MLTEPVYANLCSEHSKGWKTSHLFDFEKLVDEVSRFDVWEIKKGDAAR
jgi:hypothetical protein